MTKICIVEDDEQLASLIRKYLEQRDYNVDVIDDGDLAVDGILSARPDLVALDLIDQSIPKLRIYARSWATTHR